MVPGPHPQKQSKTLILNDYLIIKIEIHQHLYQQ